ncbi:proline-, glutamic acid- and leucine-rich protein 1-like [Lingula anatina]|uniref:Proline-, glutamic acid- and leucine-rich protein 1-like n=1 Tax=Lingula anatina TaxID=7574 RepID=A0A1S3JW04_LINAN|nr:proline-, glutamic acid- and leucine-rich protein 1-like [Lingula anatina]|eukprot:XP_013414241.1 proline-, glutamic acid- and leucine-rich protein 1-like [Lingula anatina]
MEGREHVLSVLTKNFEGNLRSLVDFRQIVDEHKLYNTQKASQIQDEISKINSGLNAAKSRVESLVLLNDLLSQCSTETLSQYAITWTRLLIQIIKGYAPASIHRLACCVLGSLAEKSSTCPELARQVALDSLPHLIPALLAMKEESLEAALYCIGKCMQFYPGPCGTFKVITFYIIYFKHESEYI